eukprot:scaffold11488_cov109-Isochrysis_galbana.AAC.9
MAAATCAPRGGRDEPRQQCEAPCTWPSTDVAEYGDAPQPSPGLEAQRAQNHTATKLHPKRTPGAAKIAEPPRTSGDKETPPKK